MNILHLSLAWLLVTSSFALQPLTAAPVKVETNTALSLSEQKALLKSITDMTVQLRYTSEVERILLDRSHGEKSERSSAAEIQLSKEIAELVPDFTYGTSHLDSVTYFLQSQFGVQAENLQIVDEKRIETREFVILDKEDQLVVKVFPMKTGSHFKFIHEISGNAAFRSLNLEKTKTVEFLAIGKYFYQGTTYILIGMEFAKGETFKKNLEKTWNQENPTVSQELLYQLGEAIGEVHLKGSKEMPADSNHHRAVTDYYRKTIDEQLQKYEARGGIYTELFRQFYSDLIEQYTCAPHYFAPYHGDAHLENFLYDPTTKTITIIDSVRAHVSVNPENEPLSDMFYMDICRMESSVIKNLLKLEDFEDLIPLLIPSLREGWESMAEKIIDPSRLQLEHYYTILTKISSAIDWAQISDPHEREIAKARLDLYEKELLQRIEKDHLAEANLN